MAGLNGKYEHIKNENVLEYFKGVGVTDEMIEKIGKLPTTLEITISGNSVTLKSSKGTTFELGKEFEDKMPTGQVAKSVATLEGNKLTINSTLDGKKGARSYETTADGLLVTLTAEETPIVGKRYYKRV
ncbi:fatty acid-binding protein, liver-type-like [Chrysoperla carnea]|uniref:fatty acid-binding protein, liver-type-like n=1 Tax=Chrysoperla carnea TaxID=189513 RepID=UPI001D06A8EF|nr:fatty acid-binding protein, liver-type-like [Chrysoperla carnea]